MTLGEGNQNHPKHANDLLRLRLGRVGLESQFSSEDLIPEGSCNAKAVLVVCKVVCKMPLLKFLVVLREPMQIY